MTLRIARARPGSTLIELLVVLVVLTTLMGMLLAGVQKVREAEARLCCQNNLRQLGVACASYESGQRGFPPAKVSNNDGRVAFGNSNRSVFVFLLPYIEQDNLARLYQCGQPGQTAINWNDPSNRPVYATPIKTFECPSAPHPRTDSFGSGPLATVNAATSDYTCAFSVTLTPPSAYAQGLIPQTLDSTTCLGMLEPNRSVKVAEVKDGTSHTLLLVECAGRPLPYAAGRSITGISRYPGGGWADDSGPISLSGFSADGRTHGGPCAVNCSNLELYAFHSGGVNVAMGDGSVRFVGSTTSIGVVAALVTRAGSEVIPAGEF
jgi:prepilin-type processing-associated H-X9-DG protein